MKLKSLLTPNIHRPRELQKSIYGIRRNMNIHITNNVELGIHQSAVNYIITLITIGVVDEIENLLGAYEA